MSSIATYILKYDGDAHDYVAYNDEGRPLRLCATCVLQFIDGQFLMNSQDRWHREIKPSETTIKLTIYNEQQENTTKLCLMRDFDFWDLGEDIGITCAVEDELDEILGKETGYYIIFVKIETMG